jgi:hypothetical protein
MELLGISDGEQMSLSHRSWVGEALKIKERTSERRWSESIAEGSSLFVKEVKTYLGTRVFGRKIISSADGHELRESQASHDAHSGGEKGPLSHENTLL